MPIFQLLGVAVMEPALIGRDDSSSEIRRLTRGYGVERERSVNNRPMTLSRIVKFQIEWPPD